MTANGNPQSLVLCILDVSVVCCCMPSETYVRNGVTPIFRSATLAEWGERTPSERTAQVLIPVRPDKTYTVFS